MCVALCRSHFSTAAHWCACLCVCVFLAWGHRIIVICESSWARLQQVYMIVTPFSHPPPRPPCFLPSFLPSSLSPSLTALLRFRSLMTRSCVRNSNGHTSPPRTPVKRAPPVCTTDVQTVCIGTVLSVMPIPASVSSPCIVLIAVAALKGLSSWHLTEPSEPESLSTWVKRGRERARQSYGGGKREREGERQAGRQAGKSGQEPVMCAWEGDGGGVGGAGRACNLLSSALEAHPVSDCVVVDGLISNSLEAKLCTCDRLVHYGCSDEPLMHYLHLPEPSARLTPGEDLCQ